MRISPVFALLPLTFLPAIAADAPATATTSEVRTLDCQGPFAKDASEASLKQAFGAQNVEYRTVPGAEGPRESQDDGATSGAPAPAPSGTTPGLPATQPAPVPLWKQPAVLVAGATALVATGVTVYALTRDSASRRLEAELERQAGEARKQ